jgi:hypothetical protein
MTQHVPPTQSPPGQSELWMHVPPLHTPMSESPLTRLQEKPAQPCPTPEPGRPVLQDRPIGRTARARSRSGAPPGSRSAARR